MKTKYELNIILQKKTKQAMLRLGQQQFEFGNKTGNLLANLLKKKPENNNSNLRSFW